MCKQCKTNPVYKQESGKTLCKTHFIRYYERKVLKTIRKYNLIDKGDKVAVSASGGKDSISLLYLLNKLCKERRLCKLEAIAINEGIHGYRDKLLNTLKNFCKKEKIKLHVFTFKKEFGFSLDEILKKVWKKKLELNPCFICGILRKYLTNKKARQLKFNKLATGHNLDDEAATFLVNLIKGNLELSAKLGPKTGFSSQKAFVQRIKPLYMCTEKENIIYAEIKKLLPAPVKKIVCPYKKSYRQEIEIFLDKFEKSHPGAKHAVVSNFLDLLPILKKRYASKELKKCKKCGEPTSNEICKTCELLEMLRG